MKGQIVYMRINTEKQELENSWRNGNSKRGHLSSREGNFQRYWGGYTTHSLTTAYFPTPCCVSIIIVSMFKSVPKSMQGNYRCISLLNSLHKVFTGILNCRIVPWLEAKSITAHCQVGFRQGRSITGCPNKKTTSLCKRSSAKLKGKSTN